MAAGACSRCAAWQVHFDYTCQTHCADDHHLAVLIPHCRSGPLLSSHTANSKLDTWLFAAHPLLYVRTNDRHCFCLGLSIAAFPLYVTCSAPFTPELLLHVRTNDGPIRSVAWAPVALNDGGDTLAARSMFMLAGHDGNITIWDARYGASCSC